MAKKTQAKQPEFKRKYSHLHSGFEDNLEPLVSLDLSKVKSFYDLTHAMSKTAFGGRIMGDSVDTLVKMSQDKDTFVVLTLSGAMTVAKMGLIICDMIDQGLVHAVVSTGALMAHGLAEASGMTHFKASTKYDDKKLYEQGYDRVYDTFELEKNLDDIEEIIFEIVGNIDPKTVLSSHLINYKIGEYLAKHTKHRGVLKSAYEKGIPVYVPAFTDSELGLDLGLLNRSALLNGKPTRRFDPLLDLEHYTNTIWKQKKLGIFTVGGGVPRNWAQQVGPYIDLINQRGYRRDKKAADERSSQSLNAPDKDAKAVMFSYGMRICPEPVYWGGLSGCTYSEGVSWGKFVPEDLGGRFAEVPSDATIVWPLIIKAALEKIGRKPLKKNVLTGKKFWQEIEKLVLENYQPL